LIQTVWQSQAEVGSLFEAKQLELIVECQSKDTCAFFDRERLIQVFINLFSNAIKFSPKESAIQVTIADSVLPERRPAFHCAVSDNGVGIPEAELEKIFDKFTQSSKTDTGAGGSGLGLAICREIVHLHGGVIWAAASPSGELQSTSSYRERLPSKMPMVFSSRPAKAGRLHLSANYTSQACKAFPHSN